MEKINRPQRNRRLNRRVWLTDDSDAGRPAKRLFTPEIKRMLKDWLIRKRQNPYPSRDEKKRLAIETGLTYTQICNWFANWRRKLKNSERERSKKSWGHLIKHYNSNAKGNVEQFSISSEDSIWGDEHDDNNNNNNRQQDFSDDDDDDDDYDGGDYDDVGYDNGSQQQSYKYNNYQFNNNNNNNNNNDADDIKGGHYDSYNWKNGYGNNFKRKKEEHKPIFQYYTRKAEEIKDNYGSNFIINTNLGGDNSITNQNNTKYKQKIMEKYLRDTCEEQQKKLNMDHLVNSFNNQHETFNSNSNSNSQNGGTTELSKWLESAEKFTPNKNNYYLEWNPKRAKSQRVKAINDFHAEKLLTLSNAQDPSTNFYHQQQQQQQRQQQQQPTIVFDAIHHKDELDAAEALANLAFNCRQRVVDDCNTSATLAATQINAISF